MIKGQIRINSL